MMDIELFNFVVGHRIAVLNPVMLMFSHRGFLALICIIWGIVLLRIPPRQKGLIAFAALGISIGLSDLAGSHILKPWVDRPRPCHLDANVALPDTCGPGKSMPSNHAVTLGAATAVVVFFLRRRGLVQTLPILFLVCLSRAYLGVHYPSDVIVGTAFGFAVAALVLGLLMLIGPFKRLHLSSTVTHPADIDHE